MGLKDTKVPMLFSVFAYGVSLPAAWFFAIHLGMGPESVWVSLGFPLLALAVALIWRFNNQINVK